MRITKGSSGSWCRLSRFSTSIRLRATALSSQVAPANWLDDDDHKRVVEGGRVDTEADKTSATEKSKSREKYRDISLNPLLTKISTDRGGQFLEL